MTMLLAGFGFVLAAALTARRVHRREWGWAVFYAWLTAAQLAVAVLVLERGA